MLDVISTVIYISGVNQTVMQNFLLVKEIFDEVGAGSQFVLFEVTALKYFQEQLKVQVTASDELPNNIPQAVVVPFLQSTLNIFLSAGIFLEAAFRRILKITLFTRSGIFKGIFDKVSSQ